MAKLIDRPWDFQLVGHLKLSDAELEVLVDRLGQTHISVCYEINEAKVIFNGWTHREPAWESFTFIDTTLRELFPRTRVTWLSASVQPGQTDAEVEAELEKMFG